MSSFATPSKASFGRWDMLPPRTRQRKIIYDRMSIGTSSCLITDIQMPGMSGADLQAQLIAEGNFTPIIFMTAFDNEKIRARVLEAGAFGYLKKPFDEKFLVRCLEKALKICGATTDAICPSEPKRHG